MSGEVEIKEATYHLTAASWNLNRAHGVLDMVGGMPTEILQSIESVVETVEEIQKFVEVELRHRGKP